MRRAGKLFAFFLGASMCVEHSWGSVPVIDMRIKLEVAKDDFKVTIQNGPNESALVSTPIMVWRPGVGGVEFKLWNSEGVQIPECVMIDYAPSQQRMVELKPADKIVQYFNGYTIKKNFCLSKGRYFLQAIFHNDFDGKSISREVLSNPIYIVVDE